jgi:hypothetical protein
VASTYSTNLGVELIGTGEQSGSWGDTTNENLGTLLEEAIVGVASVAISDAGDTTISITNGTTSDCRHHVLVLSGALTANRNLIVPAKEKTWIVINSTTGGFSVTVKVSSQTGITVPNGARRLLYCNATDVFDGINDLPASSKMNGVAIPTGLAVAGDIWTGTDSTKAVTADALWDSQAFAILVDGSTVTPNFGAGINFSLTLGGNRTIANPTNPKVGQSGVFAVIQDGTGSRTVTWGSGWDFGSAGTPTLSTAAGKIDLVSYIVLNSSTPLIRCSFQRSA